MSEFRNNPFFSIFYGIDILGIEDITSMAQKIFRKYREVGGVYLIGSYAKGNSNEYSDVDFLIFFNKGYSYQKKKRNEIHRQRKTLTLMDWWRGYAELKLLFKKPIDLIDGDFLIHNDSHLCGEIFNFLTEESILVYKKDGYSLPCLNTLKTEFQDHKRRLEKYMF